MEIETSRESMYPVPSRRIRVGDHRVTHTAICTDDKCPWKHRGVTADATWQAAEEHAIHTAHDARIYSETMTEIALKPPEREVPDWRCGCGPNTTQVECPYHGGAI